MDSVKEKKRVIRNNIDKIINSLSEKEQNDKTQKIEDRLFEFANFQEAAIVLLYINSINEVRTNNIIKRCFDYDKTLVLPAFETSKYEIKLLRVDNLESDLKTGPRKIREPIESKCKIVPIENVDIAIIPSIALDEKGGRIGTGEGYYDRLIPRLSVTTRKVALAFESQIIPQVPTESHDKHVDIIITEKRIIYKI